jgi:hypothetical protein
LAAALCAERRGEFPFSSPETFAIARFILDRPNIAAVQSYHNAGGMILRGPGTQTRENLYGAGDRAVYDEFGRIGAEMLPYYRYMIIYRDLYEVHGGFVNWTAESLGIISFTNELWNDNKYFQRDVASPSDEQTWIWRDKLAFGQTFKEFTEFDHPLHGKVLIGGQNKWARRNTPTFMLEEECHRNFAFTMFHASEMPEARFDRPKSRTSAAASGASPSSSATIASSQPAPASLRHAPAACPTFSPCRGPGSSPPDGSSTSPTEPWRAKQRTRPRAAERRRARTRATARPLHRRGRPGIGAQIPLRGREVGGLRVCPHASRHALSQGAAPAVPGAAPARCVPAGLRLRRTGPRACLPAAKSLVELVQFCHVRWITAQPADGMHLARRGNLDLPLDQRLDRARQRLP